MCRATAVLRVSLFTTVAHQTASIVAENRCTRRAASPMRQYESSQGYSGGLPAQTIQQHERQGAAAATPSQADVADVPSAAPAQTNVRPISSVQFPPGTDGTSVGSFIDMWIPAALMCIPWMPDHVLVRYTRRGCARSICLICSQQHGLTRNWESDLKRQMVVNSGCWLTLLCMLQEGEQQIEARPGQLAPGSEPTPAPTERPTTASGTALQVGPCRLTISKLKAVQCTASLLLFQGQADNRLLAISSCSINMLQSSFMTGRPCAVRWLFKPSRHNRDTLCRQTQWTCLFGRIIWCLLPSLIACCSEIWFLLGV